MRGLVFSLDDNYVMPFKVLWHSLMKTESVPENTPVFILHESTLTDGSKSDIKAFLEKYRVNASLIDASGYVPDSVLISHHISRATYYRLFLASILPMQIESAVYLDVDAVVIRSIKELFYLKLERPIAAVDHISPNLGIQLWGELSGNYFQAGVLVIDIKIWREDNVEQLFSNILKTQVHRIVFWDQDVLNIAFENKWQRLPIWYNFIKDTNLHLFFKNLREKIRFLHLAGSDKPWKIYSNEWDFIIWYELYHETFEVAFNKKIIKKPISKRIIQFLKNLIKYLLNEIKHF